MVSVFWDMNGVVYHKYLPHGMTINSARYLDTLMRLQQAIKAKHPELLSCGVVLLHDNACARTASIMQSLLKVLQWDVFGHPVYSPDLAPSDYHLFGILKTSLGGQRFTRNAEVEKWVRAFFANLHRSVYTAGIRKLVPHYEKCLEQRENYVEK